jgi:formylglycine-generating enzyme
LLTVPALVSIDRATPVENVTNAASVSFSVTFNESVTNVVSGDFLLTASGNLTTATAVVSGSGSAYTVTVDSIHGSGDLRLDLIDDDSIVDDSNVPLGGEGAGNGNFQGQTYTIDQTSPFVKSINRAIPTDPTFSGTSVTYAVKFSEPVTGVDPSDFARVLTGNLTTTAPLTVSGSDADYTVTIDGIAGDGTLGLNLTDDGSIHDLAGNALGLSDPLAWSLVGDPGNAGQLSGINVHGGGGPNAIVGAVDHSYRIGTYDVTNSQYTAMLNAKDPNGTNTLGMYSAAMGTDPVNGGISFDNARPAGSKYAVIPGHGNAPVNFVTWFDAIRFANWTNNGQGNSDTESGAYTLFGGTPTPTNASVIARNPTAQVFLPNENEWYKAAYYNPITQSYFKYATGSDTQPDYTLSSQDTNAANYVPGGWPNPDYNLSIGHVTDVGAFASSHSVYGTFDQSGNVLQWNETTITSGTAQNRGLRGGAYDLVWDHLTGAYRDSGTPSGQYANVGFRLASNTVLKANFTGQVYTDDLTPPVVASITIPDANPTGVLVVHFNVTFSENVTGVDASDFVLTTTGQGISASISSFSGSGSTYHVAALMSPTSSAHGTLGLNLVDDDSIIDEVGNRLGGLGVGNGSVTGPAYTISRDGYTGPFLFYRGSSRYDTTGNAQAQLPFSDDNAIATDKVAYLADSGASTFANVSSYSRGINGIMIDIPSQHGTITAQDFVFKVGNNNSLSTWAPAPLPITVSVRPGAGVNGLDRVELIWANNVIQKTWLQVTMKGNDALGGNDTNTGLGSSNVFYFGHAMGDSGLLDTATQATVDGNDILAARNHQQSVLLNIPISNPYDYNRDGAVDGNDQLLSRNNQTNINMVTRFVNLTSQSASPQGAPAADPAIVSALAIVAADKPAPLASSQSQTAFYSPETPATAAAVRATELMSAGDGQPRDSRGAVAHLLGELADDDLLDVLVHGWLKRS